MQNCVFRRRLLGTKACFGPGDQGRLKDGPGTQKRAWSAALSSARVLLLI